MSWIDRVIGKRGSNQDRAKASPPGRDPASSTGSHRTKLRAAAPGLAPDGESGPWPIGKTVADFFEIRELHRS